MDSIRALLQSYGGRDFLSMGRGIEGRYARCRKWWEPHLQYTRSFVERNIQPCSKLAVMGAGRLLDLELATLLDHCKEVHLFDADSSCITAWRDRAGSEFKRRVIPHIEDITESLEDWTSGLRRAIRRGDLQQFLCSLEAPQPSWVSAEYDGVISLNVAGQIPLYWRDRVLAAQPNLSNDESSALTRSMASLQCAHLRAVRECSTKLAITITDTHYYFYDSDCSEWKVEEALYGSSAAVLDHCFDARGRDCWLWHVAPQYLESDAEGVIHRVEARVGA